MTHHDTLTTLFRTHVGNGKTITFRDMEARTLVSEGVLRSLAAGKVISHENAMRILTNMPGVMRQSYWASFGMKAPRPIRGPKVCWKALTATLAGAVAKLTQYHARGRECHRERAEIKHKTLPEAAAILARAEAGE